MSLYLTRIDELCDFPPSLLPSPIAVHTSCLAISVYIIMLVDRAVVVLSVLEMKECGFLSRSNDGI